MQIVDIGPWLARDANAFPAVEEQTPDAQFEATVAIPPLPVDRRRRPLPSGRDNDRYLGERF